MEILDYPYLAHPPDPLAPGQHGIPSAILQKHREDNTGLQTALKSRGFLYNADGRTYFSPNCNRPNVTPPPLSNANDGVLQGRDYQMPDFCKPQWWTRAHGYLAFTPLFPNVATPPFHPLLHHPKVIYDRERKRPLPERKVWSAWQKLQFQIAEATHLLLFDSGAAAVRPAYPCARVDANVELGKGLTKGELKKDILAAFSWFSIWLGCLSYAVAVSEAMSTRAKEVGIRRLPLWVETLLKGDQQDRRRYFPRTDKRVVVLDEIFVSDLQNSCVTRFDKSVERVGVFVKIPDNDSEDLVSIDWLCEVGVPVWYEWGAREMKIASRNPFWQRYAPPPDAVQVCPPFGHNRSGNFLINTGPHPPSPGALCPCPSETRRAKTYPQRPEPAPEARNWEIYFKERAVYRATLLSQETVQERLNRENRERCPPTNPRKTRYFIWERDPTSESYTRRPADKDDMEDIFTDSGRFGRKQAKYDSVYNEWDLCEYFGPPDDEQLNYMAETWAGYEGTTFEEELARCRAYYGLPPFQETGGDARFSQDEASPSNSTQVDLPFPSEPPTQPAQTEVPITAYKLFGYTYALASLASSAAPGSLQGPSPNSISLFPGLVPKVLGISKLVPGQDPFWQTANGQSLLHFIQSLAKGSPLDDCWDLAKDSGMPVITLPRFKQLRRSMVSVPVLIEAWDNVKGRQRRLVEEVREAFWFASDHGQGWLIGCLSADVALLICRLDQSLTDPIALAHALLGLGVRFQTWKLVSTLPNIRLRSTGHFIQFWSNSYQYTLLRGGIVWRLAMEDIGFGVVFAGASHAAFEGYGVTRGTGCGGFLLDDDLSADEADCICGHYDQLISENGELGQMGRVSWWPPVDLWEQLCGPLGWTPDAEAHYVQRLEEIEGGYQPLPRSEWKRRLRRSSQVIRFRSIVETKSQEVITSREVR